MTNILMQAEVDSITAKIEYMAAQTEKRMREFEVHQKLFAPAPEPAPGLPQGSEGDQAQRFQQVESQVQHLKTYVDTTFHTISGAQELKVVST